MASGWAKLGQALGGVSDSERADIQAKTMNALATRDANVARARQEMMQARAQAGLGARFKELGMDAPDAMADVALSGVNYNGLTSGLGNTQEQRFRQAAVDAVTGGDWGRGNAQMLGVANGPVEIPKVAGGMLLGNRLVPGGGNVSVTPVGAAQIGADNARGQAAIIRAERPPASRASGGGRSGGSGVAKLSDIDKLRIKSAMEGLKVEKDQLLNVISEGGPKAEAARARLIDLQSEESAIFDRFEQGGNGLGGRLAPEEVAPPSTLETDDTWYQDPDTGVQKKVPRVAAPRNARIAQVGGRPVVSANSPAEAKAAWAKLAPGAGLKLPNGTIRWKE